MIDLETLAQKPGHKIDVQRFSLMSKLLQQAQLLWERWL
jgi:hypothetical protein